MHIIAPAPFGGLERVVQSLAVGHQRRGHVVSVVVVLSDGDYGEAFAAPLTAEGVRVHRFVLPGRAYRWERKLLHELLQRERPEVVHTHGYRTDVVDAGVARRLRIPTVTTVHGFTGGGLRNRTYEWLQRRSFRHFSGVVAVSRPQLARLRHPAIAQERLHLVPNGWSPGAEPLPRDAARRELGVEAGHFHLGWVGRISQEKGPDLFLNALARTRELPIMASMIGDGTDRGALERRAPELSIASRVRWHGRHPDAARIFPAFDGFILSSRTEGTPIVLFEAMACGIPIVATRVGGVPDVISEAEALLVAPDDPDALAAAIRALVSDPAAARARAQRARKRLQQSFGLQPWLDAYEAIYRGLLPGTR